MNDEKIFQELKKAMVDLLKDFYPPEKRTIEFKLKYTSGFLNKFKVVKIEKLSPKHYTSETMKYFKTRKKAELYISNKEKLYRKLK